MLKYKMNFTPEQVQKYKDMNLGLNMEDALKPVLENKFGELKKTHHYHSFDFENDKYLIELKTRRIKFGQYPTLIFSEKKLIKARKIKKENPNIKIFFFWKCNDGLFYWEYSEEGDEYFIASGGRRDRGSDEIENVVNVKIDYIKNFNDLIIIS